MEIFYQNYSTFLLLLLVILLSPICNLNSLLSYFLNVSFKTESSVWCLKGSNSMNHCKFKNVCFDSQFKSLLFFLSTESVIKGFDHYSELQKIQLSSINSHNQFYANVSVVDIDNYKIEKQIQVESKGLLFSRFKPNNIMHSIHDDLFPIYLTLESVCLGDKNCMETYRLVIHDHHPVGPFFDLYSLFSKQRPVILSELSSASNYVLCFEELLTGLSQDSIFYQYGFKKPHGPVIPSRLGQNDILRFTSFFKNKLNIKESQNSDNNIVVFKRQKNRKILNVEEVKEMITVVTQKEDSKSLVKLVTLDLYLNDTVSLIRLLSQAHALVGMHGAEMIFSLFMKPKSVVFELFPFGIQPEVVSFIKPLSEMMGSSLVYYSWRTLHKSNSIPHPEAHPSFGGITHLDKVTQEKIKNAHEVPPVKCCNNPLFLYHMYQDTYVPSEFRNFFHKSISEYYNQRKNWSLGDGMKKWFYPYTVINASCNFEMDKRLLRVNWFPPFNKKQINQLKYSLYIKDDKDYFRKEVFTDQLKVQEIIPEVFEIGAKFQVWISVYDEDLKSPDLYFECS